MISSSTIGKFTQDHVPQRVQEFAKGSLYTFGGLILTYGAHLLYDTGTCKLMWKIPNCGNDFTLTVATHTALPATIAGCASVAYQHFQKAFS